ncbi:undecaprenyldiphospho-muramoylpentapeptide beta-N-acetylglucosaminyltransferase [Piscinibacter koreensis]|uniref:UDP-N-acetylglucosamine--N-acetylmuramyl-(pentapeptide) pyrophosphoryl-undecaprenol N-acetylglucosamine transferase n=1 Tax=Piscinibacter koreensis TaxID=2742824 RepID=A0A7Y6NT95_9BURK|nr:undecaprenyldiphospho-muramoylpentapeptide beta-N-acetylglucosaminyltransferase [Schlegelella koreensis]NUZ08926.1 undecaprenyldiphospho-muramoylpentapeptide beta-N-acetylglucosaminyltransferase [Schlegelella koreensis]
MTVRNLVIVAAGTGGHVIPGLAVAAEMIGRGWHVSWLGTPGGIENRLVPARDIALDRVAFSGLRGKGLLHTLGGALRLAGAFWTCARILGRRRADAVLAMGGYLSFPAGWAAWLRRRPLVVVNADATLLLSNRALLKAADRVAFGFAGDSAAKVPNGVVTGNPVRAAIEAIAPPAERFAGRSGPLRVLVVGGSLGARVLNENVPAAIALLDAGERPEITHQTGEADRAAVTQAYARAGVPADVRAFIDDMAERLANCDVIVCRAGAITVSELCAAGVASVLVPFIASTTAHQRDNAAWLASHGAAIHLPQGELTAARLAELLRGLTREALLAMASKARALARPHAAGRVADEIERLVAA